MKHSILLIMAISLCLIFCGCKSSEATAVDNAILAIGEASFDNIGKMNAALKSYNDLTAEQKQEVENYDTLMNYFSQVYKQAQALFNSREYSSAKRIFMPLGKYNDSAEYVEYCNILETGNRAYTAAADYLKEQLINPFSLKIIKTTFSFEHHKNSDYRIIVNFQYVAENSFGGSVNDTFSFPSMVFVQEKDIPEYEAVFYLYSNHFSD